jgi:phospholipid transport system transporter-binding protein
MTFVTVGALLKSGTDFLAGRSSARIDLAGVQAADSAGLALLVEWLSLSCASGCTLKYENIPAVFLQLARLSELEPLLIGDFTPAGQAAQGLEGSGPASGSSGG